ncbi:MAG: ABC transporter ATP-binding protein [Bacteroidota bacterium]
MIEIRNLSNFILNNVNLSIKKGELFVLLGPNGSGKTTLLNSIAGICKYKGEINISDKLMEKIPPHRRDIGYLFQDLFLFPHMTVYENIAFGLKAKKMEYKKRVEELLDLLNLKELSNRVPLNLSGGEKQKVALARAIAINPGIVLMDEPFNKLDLTTTKYLRIEFKNIIKTLDIACIFVTHNIKEATELADTIGVIINGKIHQVGKPDEIFFSPGSEEVLSFIGRPNILECDEYKYLEDGLTKVKCGELNIIIPTEKKTPVKKVVILSENVFISAENPPGPQINRYDGNIIEIKGNNSTCNIDVEVKGKIIHCQLNKKYSDSLQLKRDKKVYVIFQLKWLKWI